MAIAEHIRQSVPEERFKFEDRIVLRNISWETYERLLDDLADSSVPRLTYDEGTLELMSPSSEHGKFNHWLGRMVDALSEELDIVVLGAGSTTWRRRELNKGLEPDSCCYIANEARVRGRRKLDLSVDPPPDLAIEVEVSRGVVGKLPIYAALGVPEVWRYDLQELQILRLTPQREYAASAASAYFPPASIEGIRQFIAEAGVPNETAWIKRFRQWVRESLLK